MRIENEYRPIAKTVTARSSISSSDNNLYAALNVLVKILEKHFSRGFERDPEWLSWGERITPTLFSQALLITRCRFVSWRSHLGGVLQGDTAAAESSEQVLSGVPEWSQTHGRARLLSCLKGGRLHAKGHEPLCI
jgi:hypothetical protein